jgi:3D (Asp-Asp-Asp) domain-containing protein
LKHFPFPQLLLSAAVAICCSVLLTSCETTTRVSSRRLPVYETPIAKRDFQTVRTTAYTHTEADHLQYTDHNALGGQLHAASGGAARAAYVARALPADSDSPSEYQRASDRVPLESFLAPQKRKVTRWVKTRHGRKKMTVTEVVRPVIGSAAADWARWPAGTTFRLLSTGQIYKVDDYGWALSGRNTIDLYMASRSEMNQWGLREERIQILRWGDPQASAHVLQGRQGYKHLRRMLLELHGQEREAAALE